MAVSNPNPLLAAFVGAVLTPTFSAAQESTDGIRWMTDLPAAEAAAAKSKKPMLLVFR
jgi:hypothetical protein